MTAAQFPLVAAFALSSLTLACSGASDEGSGGDGDGDALGGDGDYGGDDDARGDGDGDARGDGDMGGDGDLMEGCSTDGDIDGIQYFGRWDHSAPGEHSASWGAVYFTTHFTGTSVTLDMTGGTVDYQYRIDGGEFQILSPGAETEHVLAEGLEDGEHLLEFYRRSGGSFGTTTVRGLILDDGAELLPSCRPERKIEVLGDSISVGYGNNTPEGSPAGTNRQTENGYDAYGPQLARMFDAQWSVVAHSGQGMVKNLSEAVTDMDTNETMSDEFMMTHFPGQGSGGDWDFNSWQPDVLVVTLGTNDFSWVPWDKSAAEPGVDFLEEDEALFVAEYQAFLEKARGLYPEATIFAVGTFLSSGSNQFAMGNGWICDAVDNTDDTDIHCIDPGYTGEGWLQGPGDYIGDWTHPHTAGNTKIAEGIAAHIETVMGW